MKKQFIFLKLIVLTLFLSTSCSSDDDGGISQESRNLFGTWELESITQNNQNIFEIPCEDKRGFVFRNNFTYTETTFAGEDDANCEVAANFNGTWEDIENGVLNLKRAGQSNVETLVINFRTRGNTQLFEVTESPNRILIYAKIQ